MARIGHKMQPNLLSSSFSNVQDPLIGFVVDLLHGSCTASPQRKIEEVEFENNATVITCTVNERARYRLGTQGSLVFIKPSDSLLRSP